MAKGQQRSNKEVRKPKKPKALAEVPGRFAGTVQRVAGAGNRPAAKSKA